jgi:hypothetical protein
MDNWAWGQFALVAWAAACLFLYGARSKSIPITGKTVWEIAQAVAIVVILFGVLTEGRGCSRGTADLLAPCTFGDDGC